MNLLLSRRASIDDNGKNALQLLVARKRSPSYLPVDKANEEITELLLSKGVNVDAGGRDRTTSLCIATERGDLEIVKHLSKCRADVNSAYTFRTQHLKNDSQESKGSNVNAKGRHGATSLHLAAQWGYLTIVQHLLKHGVNVDFSSLGVRTPLHLAIEYGHEKIVKLFLECGATINSKDTNDTTPCC